MCSLWARQWHLNVPDSSSMTHIGIRFLVTLAELDFWRQSCFERLATTSPGSLLDIIFIARLLLILFRHESCSLFGWRRLTIVCQKSKRWMWWWGKDSEGSALHKFRLPIREGSGQWPLIGNQSNWGNCANCSFYCTIVMLVSRQCSCGYVAKMRPKKWFSLTASKFSNVAGGLE